MLPPIPTPKPQSAKSVKEKTPEPEPKVKTPVPEPKEKTPEPEAAEETTPIVWVEEDPLETARTENTTKSDVKEAEEQIEKEGEMGTCDNSYDLCHVTSPNAVS